MTEPAEPPHPVDLAFTSVDDQPEAELLVTTVEATARWPAVQQLRRWERGQLALGPGDRLLDVGCGIGDVALALAEDVVPGGHVVAVDASRVMLDRARQEAADNGARPVLFRHGDAFDLGEPDASFTAVRSERVLQWLDDPERAVREMGRVLAPGGRLSLIDTDWRTLAHDAPGDTGRGRRRDDGARTPAWHGRGGRRPAAQPVPRRGAGRAGVHRGRPRVDRVGCRSGRGAARHVPLAGDRGPAHPAGPARRRHRASGSSRAWWRPPGPTASGPRSRCWR